MRIFQGVTPHSLLQLCERQSTTGWDVLMRLQNSANRQNMFDLMENKALDGKWKREELLGHRPVGWTTGPHLDHADLFILEKKHAQHQRGGSFFFLAGILYITQDASNIMLNDRTTGFATLESNVKLTVERHYFRGRFEQIWQNPSLKMTCIIRAPPRDGTLHGTAVSNGSKSGRGSCRQSKWLLTGRVFSELVKDKVLKTGHYIKTRAL